MSNKAGLFSSTLEAIGETASTLFAGTKKVAIILGRHLPAAAKFASKRMPIPILPGIITAGFVAAETFG